MVFEDFSTPSNAHVDVIVVATKDVPRDQDVDPKAIVDLGPLTGTTGMQHYSFSAALSVNAMTYHTVALWDTQMTRAVAASPGLMAPGEATGSTDAHTSKSGTATVQDHRLGAVVPSGPS